MSEIVRGTTPTIRYTFSTVDPADISNAVLTIAQRGTARITKTLAAATVGEGTLSWTLTQAETLSLSKTDAEINLDWLLESGIRGAGVTLDVKVLNPGVNEVMT